NITSIVRTIYNKVKATKPWVRISCSPVGKFDDLSRYSARGWAAFSTVHQDAQGWLREGIMDMLCPMMYFQGDHFYPFAADWQERAYGRTVAPGLGIYFLHPKERDWELGVVQRQLCYLRQQGLGGQAYFRSQFLTDNTKGIYDYLQHNFYPHPALLPAMTWQSDVRPEAPKLVRRERLQGIHERLQWSAIESQGVPCRYAIYASKQEPADTEQAANLVCVTWQTEYTYNLLTSTLYGLHLAITAIDRYGNESQPMQIP
ncbi:MAG: family 10 glycosylhydrolase, partial [Bacteroidaceae bacterium]|nr:family 10 glycosylhydrolase [Bacteroidaceae bacterium]